MDLASHFTASGQQLQRITPGDISSNVRGTPGQDSSNSSWDESNHTGLRASILSKSPRPGFNQSSHFCFFHQAPASGKALSLFEWLRDMKM